MCGTIVLGVAELFRSTLKSTSNTQFHEHWCFGVYEQIFVQGNTLSDEGFRLHVGVTLDPVGARNYAGWAGGVTQSGKNVSSPILSKNNDKKAD